MALNGKMSWKIPGGTPGNGSSMRLSTIGIRFSRRKFRHPGGLLVPIRLPALVDEIGVNVFDVLFAQNVAEALHTP